MICILLNIKHIARKLANTDGSEVAEAALVMPLVFMLLLGIIWFGRAFNIYSTITQAAQQGAITAARPVCATCVALANNWNNFPPDAKVESAVFSIMNASSIDTSQVKASAPTVVPCTLPPPASNGACVTTGNNVTICRDVQLNASGATPAIPPTQCGAVVSFQYPFQFYLPLTSLNLQTITLTATAQSRMEN